MEIIGVIVPVYQQTWALPYAIRSVFRAAAHVVRHAQPREVAVSIVVVCDEPEVSQEVSDVCMKAWQELCLTGRVEWDVICSGRRGGDGAAVPINAGRGYLRRDYLRRITQPNWVTWVSADNIMVEHWLSTLFAAVSEDHPAAYGGYTWTRAQDGFEEATLAALAAGSVGGNSHTVLPEPWSPYQQIRSEACRLGPAHLIRDDYCPSHDPRWGPQHDLDHWLRAEEFIFEAGLRPAVVPEVLCHYLAHRDRATDRLRDRYCARAVIEAACARRRSRLP